MRGLAVCATGLVKVYGGVRALDGLDLRVPQGTVYGFLGRNGAGKTSTIKILLGLTRPSEGSAQVFGLDILRDRVAILRRTAFVSESKALYEWMTGSDLVRFARAYYPRWSDSVADVYVRRLQVPMDRPWGKLSQGNRVKVYLVLALAQGAELLVLDEPTTGLDPVAADELLRLLVEDHRSYGRTIVFSSHQLSEVELIADWVGIIDEGRMLLEMPFASIRNELCLVTATGNSLPTSRSTQVISVARTAGCWRYLLARDSEGFVGTLRQLGATVTNVSRVNLREVFLELVGKGGTCTLGNAGGRPEPASSSS